MAKLSILLLAVIIFFSSTEAVGAQDNKHHWLFPNHPKLRRFTKAAGFGAATGGVLAPMLGAGAVTGATVGATEHATVRGVKDEHDQKKHKQLDSHVW